MNQYAACLGIDWADKKHDLCLIDTATGKKTKQVLPHTPQAIAEYFTSLRLRYPGQQIAVGLEHLFRLFPGGGVAQALLLS